MDDVKVEQWQQWIIDLTDFNQPSDVNIENIARSYIGFGNGTAGGSGLVHFDDLALMLPQCVPSKTGLNYDITGEFGVADCTVISGTDFYVEL